MTATNIQVFLLRVFLIVIITLPNSESNFAIKDIIKKAISIDEIICNILQSPQKRHKMQLNKHIKSYIDEVEKIVVKLMTSKEEIQPDVKGFIEEGGARFMKISFNMEDMENSFNWNEKQHKEFKTLRERSRDVWYKVSVLREEAEEGVLKHYRITVTNTTLQENCATIH